MKTKLTPEEIQEIENRLISNFSGGFVDDYSRDIVNICVDEVLSLLTKQEEQDRVLNDSNSTVTGGYHWNDKKRQFDFTPVKEEQPQENDVEEEEEGAIGLIAAVADYRRNHPEQPQANDTEQPVLSAEEYVKEHYDDLLPEHQETIIQACKAFHQQAI